MRVILILLFQLNYVLGVSCDCHEKLWNPFQPTDYDEVDLIYLVEIGLEVDSDVFEVKLIESFKGEFNPNIKIVIDDYCSYKVSTGERWIIYSNVGPTDFTSIYGCSRSRNIDERKYWIPPPPPPPTDATNKRKYSMLYQKYLNSDRGDISSELKQLREIKKNAR